MNRVTLAAEIIEHALARDRIADVVAQILAHFGDDFFAFGISLFANFPERLFDGPERFAIVALQDFAKVVGVEDALGKLVGEHRIKQLASPRFALHDEVNRQRL